MSNDTSNQGGIKIEVAKGIYNSSTDKITYEGGKMKKFEMTDKMRMEIIQEFLEKKCFPILVRKGRASSGGTPDPNAGFELSAMPESGVDKYHVWWIYASKQIFRLKTWISKRSLAESLAETCADVVNYILILVTMLVQEGYIDLGEAPMLEKEDEDKPKMATGNWTAYDSLKPEDKTPQ